MKKIILLFLLIFLCTGCDYKELSDYAIITGIGFDKEDNNYKVSLMIANASNLQSSSKEGDSTTTVITGIGKTISDAIKDCEKIIPKDIYLGHLNTAIINEEIAKTSIYPILEYLTRNPESIRKVYLIISKDTKSENILKTLSPLENFPAESIVTNIKNASKNLGIVTDTLLSEFISNTINNGIENTVSTIILKGNKPASNLDDLKETEVKSELKLDNLAIFKDYKLIKYVDENISKGINIINNKIEKLEFTIPCYENLDNYIVAKIDNIKTKIEIINDKTFYFKIQSSGSINETNCKLDLEDENVINNINNSVNSYVYDIINNSLKEIKKSKSDIFGLGNLLYKENPKYFKSINNWNENLENIDYKIKIDINMKSKGSLKNTIKETKNENN